MAVIKDVIPLYDISSTFSYVCNRQKTVHVTETLDVIDMIRQGKVENIMASGYGGACISQDLCMEQFLLAKASYQDKHPNPRKMPYVRIPVEDYLRNHHKTRLPKKLKKLIDKDGNICVQKHELIAVHLIISFHETDRLSPKMIRSVLDDFFQHKHLRGFLALAVPHWNTDNSHIHILICNYHPSGCYKLCLTTSKLRELRRFLDKICFDYNLSICNSREARSNPEHREWIDNVIAEGKITVWPAKNTSTKNYMVNHAKKVFDTYAKSQNLKTDFQREFWTSHAEGWRYFVPNEVDITLKSATQLDNQQKKLDPSSIYRVNAFIQEKGIGREKSKIEILFELCSNIIKGETLFYHKIYQALSDLDLDRQIPEAGDVSLFLGSDFGETNIITETISDYILIVRSLNIRTRNEAIYFADAIDKKINDTKEAITLLTRKITQTPQLAKIYRVISSSPDSLNHEELFLSLKGSNAYSSDDEIKQNIKLYYNIRASRDYLKDRLNELEQDYSTAKKIEETLYFLKAYTKRISKANKELLSYCHCLNDYDYSLLREYCDDNYMNYEDLLSQKYHSLDKIIKDAKSNTIVHKRTPCSIEPER